MTPGFTAKYGCMQLVWYEEHLQIGTAIQREKSLSAGIGNGRST